MKLITMKINENSILKYRFLSPIVCFALIVSVVAYAPMARAESGETLEKTLRNGYLTCGVSQGLAGFSNPDSRGRWKGIDVDFCRAMAAAIFSNPSKVRYTPTSAKERFTALQSGEFDVLARNTTWTMQRDVALGLDFSGVLYYDGQGFMVRKNLGVKNALDLSGASVCVNAGTTTELNVADYFRSNGMQYEIVSYEKTDEVIAAYDDERCDVYTTDLSGVFSNRLKLANPDEHMVLKEVISKEPLGPVVRQGDAQWGDIARWTLYAMVNAEELGITSRNVDRMRRRSKNPSVLRLLGKEGAFGKSLGLSDRWAYNIIKKVGNYGEIYERNLGENTRLNIPRGQNDLWTRGGLIYAPPVR